MTAFDTLRAEPTPFRDLSIADWHAALVKVARKQVTPDDLRDDGEGSPCNLAGTLWVVLNLSKDPGIPSKLRWLAGLIEKAIEEMSQSRD
jgi:hypothetical protein